MDWWGSYNIYYLCPATYGDWSEHAADRARPDRVPAGDVARRRLVDDRDGRDLRLPRHGDRLLERGQVQREPGPPRHAWPLHLRAGYNRPVRKLLLFAATTLVLVAAAGCSGGDDDAAATAAQPTTPTAATTSPAATAPAIPRPPRLHRPGPSRRRTRVAGRERSTPPASPGRRRSTPSHRRRPRPTSIRGWPRHCRSCANRSRPSRPCQPPTAADNAERAALFIGNLRIVEQALTRYKAALRASNAQAAREALAQAGSAGAKARTVALAAGVTECGGYSGG